jgi:RibD C-terminal domain
VILLGHDVPDRHLAELTSDGISYIVADGPEIDLPAMLDVLGGDLGIRCLLLEGGGGVNGSLLAAGLVDEVVNATVGLSSRGSCRRAHCSAIALKARHLYPQGIEVPFSAIALG